MIQRSSLQACGRPIVVASHMRSGTHLMIDLLRRQFADCRSWKWPGERNGMLYLPLDVLTQPVEGWSETRVLKVLHRARSPILKTHWTLPDLSNLRVHQPEFADWIESDGTFVHIVRNPFHVLASQWAWDCSVGKIPQGQTRPTLQWIETAIASWVHHYGIWSQRENTTVFRYEDIISDPRGAVARLYALLGENAVMRQPLLPGKLRGPWHSRWSRIAGIRPDSTEIITRGGAPDPAALFDEVGIELVLRIAGGSLEALGYGVPAEGESHDTNRSGSQPLPAPSTRVNFKSSGH